MLKVGIESINIYGGSLSLGMRDLALARGKDPDKVVSDYMIERRALNPPWEDIITMSANAAAPLMTDELREQIGLFIVGTEGSTDFGKPISTNLLEALNLNSNVRNFETKHACYSGMAALNSAIDWIASGNNHGRKALVIGTDFSRKHFNTKQEFVMGGVATAMIISAKPQIVEFELGMRANWTTNIYDTYRPTAFHEMGNNEVSLFSYLDALEGSYSEYSKLAGPIDLNDYFKKFVFHTPFAGMAFQAYRSLANKVAKKPKAELQEDFKNKVLPALTISQLVGSCYASSNYAGLVGHILNGADLRAGDRLGLFAYGSGAIGEFYSAIVCAGAREKLEKMEILASLDRRRSVSVEEYEEIENLRETYVENPNFTPDLAVPESHYDDFYRGNSYYVLRSVEDFKRIYEWS